MIASIRFMGSPPSSKTPTTAAVQRRRAPGRPRVDSCAIVGQRLHNRAAPGPGALGAATHPDPEAWPEGENPRGDRLPAVAVRPRRWQVVDGEPERREEAGEPHEIRDEHAGRHAVEPG